MPKKKKTTTDSDIDEQFIQNFARALRVAITNPYYFNPLIQNELLKNINMNPARYDRDKVEKLLENPKVNERELRHLAQYLENNIMQFKRLINYFASILTFDWYVEPIITDDIDINSSAFKKNYQKVLDWLDKLDIKKTFREVMRGVMLEDAKFYYIRESKNGIRLQEMPSDYCLINYKNDLGWQYAFNMTYFLQPGVRLSDFAPEFTQYYNDFLSMKDKVFIDEDKGVRAEYHNGRYFYWQDLDPEKAVVFKFNENYAGIIPPLMGVFIDAIEIDTYKRLEKTKAQLETWKLIINKIPLANDGKGTGNKKDNFAITADVAATFNAMMQNAMPEGVKVIATPFQDVQDINFEMAENRNTIVGRGNQNFWDSSGTSPVLFGTGNTTGSAIKGSQLTDYYFVEHMYYQFMRFLNYHVNRITGNKYTFKVHLEGSIFDRQERFDTALKAAQYGFPKSWVASAMGKTPQELINMAKFENSVELIDLLQPLSSSYTTSNQGGRPLKPDSQLSDKGEEARDKETNVNR